MFRVSSDSLFAKTPCPLGKSCSREPCLFSHDLSLSLPRLELPAQPVDPPAQVIPAKRPASPPPKTATRPGPSTTKTSDEPPQKVPRINGAKDAKVAKITKSGAPTIQAKPGSSKIPIVLRQTMLETLFTHYTELYSDISSRHPRLAAEHALAQEEDICAQSSQPSYRNMIINACAKIKKRPKPDSMTHNSVGTEAQIAKRIEEQRSLQAFKLTATHLIDLVLTPEQEEALGYMTAIPDGPGGDRPSSEGDDLPCCDRCKKPFKVVADPNSLACEHHWGKSYHIKVAGEKERQRIFTCCSQPSTADPCAKGPHVFVEKDPADLHARIPFVETTSSSPDIADVVALDCEMIYSTAGLSLARVSVVDGQGELLMDELVRMDEGVAVIDFNTRFSGVTSLEEAKLDLRAVRKVLSSYIGPNTVIVGHALDNDLRALRLVHRKCLDTCALFPHRGGLPYRRALRDLVREKLSKSIQEAGGTVGHSSLEDARATLDLVKWFILNTPKTPPKVAKPKAPEVTSAPVEMVVNS